MGSKLYRWCHRLWWSSTRTNRWCSNSLKCTLGRIIRFPSLVSIFLDYFLVIFHENRPKVSNAIGPTSEPTNAATSNGPAASGISGVKLQSSDLRKAFSRLKSLSPRNKVHPAQAQQQQQPAAQPSQNYSTTNNQTNQGPGDQNNNSKKTPKEKTPMCQVGQFC